MVINISHHARQLESFKDIKCEKGLIRSRCRHLDRFLSIPCVLSLLFQNVASTPEKLKDLGICHFCAVFLPYIALLLGRLLVSEPEQTQGTQTPSRPTSIWELALPLPDLSTREGLSVEMNLNHNCTGTQGALITCSQMKLFVLLF